MSNERIETLLEVRKLSRFIDAWQVDNPYDPTKLNEHNRKFTKDMDIFFKESDFKFLKRENFY